MRWIVGDLQGCAREFDDLLRAIAFDPVRDELWAAGDLVNRGPDSLATVRLWHDVGGKGVIGNHEVYALCVRSGRWPRKADTLDELFDDPDADTHLRRLRQLPALVHLPAPGGEGPGAWLVHAGVHPQWDDLFEVARRLDGADHDDDWLEHPDVSWVTRVRCCDDQGERVRHHGKPESCPPPHRPWDAFYRGAATVVHGHWAWRGHYRGERTIGLDSGCVYGGDLTAWCQDEDRIVAVPCRNASGYA